MAAHGVDVRDDNPSFTMKSAPISLMSPGNLSLCSINYGGPWSKFPISELICHWHDAMNRDSNECEIKGCAGGWIFGWVSRISPYQTCQVSNVGMTTYDNTQTLSYTCHQRYAGSNAGKLGVCSEHVFTQVSCPLLLFQIIRLLVVWTISYVSKRIGNFITTGF